MTKSQLIALGFGFFRLSGLHRLLRFWTRGQGAILMFHHVRPWQDRDFAPNRLLEITPDFLDAVVTELRRQNFEIVSLDAALMAGPRTRPFAVLSFDDGYRDFTQHALPVLERHAAPFTLYVASGFAERSARLWWVELEAAIARLDKVEVDIEGVRHAWLARDAAEKRVAFADLYRVLRAGSEERLLGVIAQLGAAAGVDPRMLVEDLCLDWSGIEALAGHPLATIGVHTVNHPMLAKHPEAIVRHELLESRRLIEMHLGRPARHLAYPVGDPTSAGRREFDIAAELGFESAVTTRPGMIFPAHRAHLTALPRLSINGAWQSLDLVDILLSGAPFALWNRGRRLNLA